MNTYSITQDSVPIAGTVAQRLLLKFGEPASNDLIVRDVDAQMRALKSTTLTGGRLVVLNGAASLPVIAAIVHHVAHLFAVVAVYDPKLGGYVVAISHDPDLAIGDILS